MLLRAALGSVRKWGPRELELPPPVPCQDRDLIDKSIALILYGTKAKKEVAHEPAPG